MNVSLASLFSRLPVGRTCAVGCAALALTVASAHAAAADGWISLFDGHAISGWHTFGSRMPVKWIVQDGAIAWTDHAGDLATDAQYGDFEFEFEWKISSGGNSGVLFRVDPVTTDRQGAPHSGPEYQLLDDPNNKDGTREQTSTSSLYGLYARTSNQTKPAGEWNHSRIVARGPHVEYWLNGKQVVVAEIGSEDWKARVAKSKFAQWPEYATFARGYLVLQDHHAPVWFRNLRIRPLP